MYFSHELKIKKKYGFYYLIVGNPLRCDCYMRPLIHFYQTVKDLPMSFTDIICNSPAALANKFLYEVMDENLNCVNLTKRVDDDLNIMPDLIFREIF